VINCDSYIKNTSIYSGDMKVTKQTHGLSHRRAQTTRLLMPPGPIRYWWTLVIDERWCVSWLPDVLYPNFS